MINDIFLQKCIFLNVGGGPVFDLTGFFNCTKYEGKFVEFYPYFIIFNEHNTLACLINITTNFKMQFLINITNLLQLLFFINNK